MVRARPVSMLYIHIKMVIMVTILYLHNFNGLERGRCSHIVVVVVVVARATLVIILWPVYDNYVHDILCTLAGTVFTSAQ